MDQAKNLGMRECYVPLVDIMKEFNQSTPRSSKLLTNMQEFEKEEDKRTEDTTIPGKRMRKNAAYLKQSTLKKQTDKRKVEDFITSDNKNRQSNSSNNFGSDWEVEQKRHKKPQHKFRYGSKLGSDWKSHKKKHTEISDYEKMILQNKNRGLAFLKSLNLNEVKENYCKAVQDLKPPRKIYSKRLYCVIPTVLTRSRRLAQLSKGTAETFLSLKSDLTLKKKIFPRRVFGHTLEQPNNTHSFTLVADHKRHVASKNDRSIL